MDLSAMGKEACRANKGGNLQEDPEAEADLEGRGLITEKEETESSDDITTQYSIHPPFDFPYFLLLQGYSHRQVRFLNHIFENHILLFYHYYYLLSMHAILWMYSEIIICSYQIVYLVRTVTCEH